MQADLFCRVVDNFGDIGVTWRLARQLQQEHHWEIRLWVDDLKRFKRIEPRVELNTTEQQIDHIQVVHWTSPAPEHHSRQIVIASFSCDLPESYIRQMSAPQHLWINLEYLSAETWVEGCHGLPSLRSDGLIRYFFFPGFNAQTGGLLRETTLFAQRDAWRNNQAEQRRFINALGVPKQALEARLLSLFCYPEAPVKSLMNVLSTDTCPSVLLIPDGIAPHLAPGQYGNLLIVNIPFVSQQDYDRILWTADLNIVRGEDSVMRALWAGTPFIWHIYPQSEDTHLIKLEAWLALSHLSGPAQRLLRDWNTQVSPDVMDTSLRTALSPVALEDWCKASALLCEKLGQLDDLATSLHDFCRQKLDN